MATLKRKEGDKVTIKSINWFVENADENYDIFPDEPGVPFFCGGMDEYCGKSAVITKVVVDEPNVSEHYVLDIDGGDYMWADFMFEDKPTIKDKVIRFFKK